MSATGFDSVWLLVALLPGFFSVKVRDFYLPPRRGDAFDRSFEVVAFALGNYLVAGTAFLVCCFPRDGLDLSAAWAQLSVAAWWGLSAAVFLYVLTVSSVVLGGIVGWIACNDLHYRLARQLRFTTRTGCDDVWQDAFADVEKQWHSVHFADGRRAMGVARYFSDRGDKPSLYLREASWIAEDGAGTPIRGDGILVSEAARIQCVEFLTGGQP